jgi:hypothetical protein
MSIGFPISFLSQAVIRMAKALPTCSGSPDRTAEIFSLGMALSENQSPQCGIMCVDRIGLRR